MYFITMKLRRSYAVAVITLWPVIEKKYDAVTRSYDGKITDTHSYVGKIVDARSYYEKIAVTPQGFQDRTLSGEAFGKDSEDTRVGRFDQSITSRA